MLSPPAPPLPTSIYRPSSSPLTSIAYFQTPTHLLVGTQSGQLLQLDRNTKRVTYSYDYSSSILSLITTPTLYTCQTRNSGVFLHDARTNQVCGHVDTQSSSFCRAALQDSSPMLLACAGLDEKAMSMWDVRSATPAAVHTYGNIHGMLMDTKFIDSEHVCGLYEDGMLVVYSLKMPREAMLEIACQDRQSVATSVDLFRKPDGLVCGIAGGASDELSWFTLRVDSLEASSEFKPASATPGRGKGVGQIRIRPSDRRVAAVAAWDSRVRVVHVRTGRHLAVFKQHKEAVTCVDFGGADWMASGGKDGLVCEWRNLFV